MQQAKSQLLLLTSRNEATQEKLRKQQGQITEQKKKIQGLKNSIQQISKENDNLRQTAGHRSSIGKLHKQTQTAHPGEDVTAEGSIIYPSPVVMNKIMEKKDQQFTQKYVDPSGEARIIPIMKLHSNMHATIRRHLSKRYRICRVYTQGKGAKVDWLAKPKNQRIT